MPPSSPNPVLEETVREAESVLERQLRGIEQADGKFERLIALSTTALGGTIAVAFFTAQNLPGALGPWTVIVFLGGVVLTLASIGLFLAGYIGLQHHVDVAIGPDMEWLEEKSQDPDWDLTDHYLALVSGFTTFFRANHRTMETKAERRAWGTYLLAGGVVLVTVSVGLVLESSLST